MEGPNGIVLDKMVIVRHLRGRKEETKLIQRLQEFSTVRTTIVNAFELCCPSVKGNCQESCFSQRFPRDSILSMDDDSGLVGRT
jgi:predicted nucleic acid-binding protein